MDITKLNEMLKNVQKPARYMGGEFGISTKKENAMNFAFAFPDTYEVGMSHLGHKILYDILDKKEGVYPQRVYAPWPDMAEELKKNNVKLFSLEDKRPLDTFDIIGFSIQYEMCLTNVLLMLELSGIPLLAKDRDENCPIIMAGGPCCVNPEPFCEIFDLISIGEGEETLPAIVDCYKQAPSKEEFLKNAVKIEGTYIPKFYNPAQKDSCIIPVPNVEFAPKNVTRSIVRDFEASSYPEHFIVPFIAPVHDRAMIEVMRGCPRGCRFCQAGMIYRPVRERSLERNKALADKLLESTGYEEIALSSLSSTDYFGCSEIVDYITDKHQKDKVNVSLPSLRLDSFSVDVADKVQRIRKTTLTFAPEAGSQRMRDVINKNLSEEMILSSLERAFERGYSKIKLYFMMGLPFETLEDVGAIADLTKKIQYRFRTCTSVHKAKNLSLGLSVAVFVPKPHTPFEFCHIDTPENIKEKQSLLRRIMPKNVKLSMHDSPLSRLEAVFAKGDRRLNKVLVDAYKNGCVFDAWSEYFDMEKWENAFKQNGMDLFCLSQKETSTTQELPWDFIKVGVDKSFLLREFEKAKNAITSPNCFEGCAGCMINNTYEGACKK